MITINFTKEGGTKVVNYRMTCDTRPTFSVSNDATSWLKITNVNLENKKITVSAKTNDTSERTGYVIATIGTLPCNEKKLQVTQAAGGGGGGCDCTNVSYSTTSLSWPNGGTTPMSVTITPPNGCTISELDADFSGSGDDYFTTAKTTNQITVTPKNGITSNLVTDTLTISFKLTGNAQPCTKAISVSWKKATPVTCDCSSAPTLTYNGQTLQEPLTWDNNDTNTRRVDLSLGNCTINTIQARIKEETLREYFGITGSTLGAESSIVLGPHDTHTPSEDINATVQYRYKVNNTTDCTDWREFAIKWKGTPSSNFAVEWDANNQLLTTGEVRRRAASWSSNDPMFDVDEISINTPEWITAEVEESTTTPKTGYVYLTYGYTPVSRMTTVGATYRRAQAEGEDGGQKDLNQNGELYQDGLYFKITNNTLEPCGGSEYKIGEYCFDVLKPKDNPSDPDEYYFNYVENTSFTCTTKPDWVSHVTFGIPDTNTRKGNIYATYSRNPSSTESRTWNNITITYSGYQDVSPVGSTTMTQGAVTASVGVCGESVNPGTAPTTCSEANFYHWDNPYVPGDLSYYYLEHDVSAYEQTYILRTAADFNEYITRENGTKIPISTIENSMWEDVRVEIWDVVPDIVHNSACGLHHVEVQPGDSFATIKERHTSGNSQSTCACPCYFNGWNPNNGAYEIYGTKETALIAVYENGNLKTSETDEEAYSNFWLKAKYDGRNDYNEELDCREIQFEIKRNTFDGAFDRCAMIKVYPKINGEYCTADCQDCERTARCQNNRNCCLTDMVVQESVNCSDVNEYFDPNHAYFNTYITSDYNQPVNSMLYDYWWGPCNDCWNGGTLAEDCDSTTTPYINAVDIYDATMIDKCGESSTQTDTCHDNIYGDYKIGDYLGTIYADGIYDDTDGRFQFTGDDCIRFDEDEHITGITIESKYDSDNEQYRGHIQLIATPYAPTGEIKKYGDPNRYRVRILVPYHKGVNYSTGNSGCFFTKNEKFWLYYGPESLNRYGWDGLTNGEFCVLRQDGLNKGNV